MTLASTSTGQRSQALDMAKGIAIILVVYGHCLRGLLSANIVPPDSGLVLTDYVIYTFHMPVFFFISGLFFAGSRDKPAGSFWQGRLRMIVYPYFLWSLVQGTIQVALSGSSAVNATVGADRLLEILWVPISPFWFLYALFFCNVLAYVLAMLRTDMLAAGAFIAFVALHFAGAGVVGDIAYGFFYFTLGMLARKRIWLTLLPVSRMATGALCALFLLAAVGAYYAGIPERLPVLAAILGIAAMLALCARLEQSKSFEGLCGLLALLGQFSMSIYVLHILVLGFVRTVLLRFMGIDDPAILIPTATVAAIAIPVLIQMAAIRLHLNDLLGLPSSVKIKPIRRQAVNS